MYDISSLIREEVPCLKQHCLESARLQAKVTSLMLGRDSGVLFPYMPSAVYSTCTCSWQFVKYRSRDRSKKLGVSRGYCGSIGLPVTREADIYSDHGPVSDLGIVASRD